MSDYITPGDVCELIPGMTLGQLAQMRYQGRSGLKFYKPTPKTVLYKRSEVLEWIESSARVSTAN
jgi:hypothetical protein